MDTKKTILVSALTTLATMLVVAMVMHLCSSHCGNRLSCAKASSHCSQAKSDCGSSASCASYSKCGKSKSSKCSKSKSCSSKSKCSKSSSCKKGEKVYEWKSEDGDKVIKKVITVDIEEEE